MVRLRFARMLPLIAVALAACGPGAEKGQLVSKALLNGADELTTENGMTTNGMTTNGMTTNGMTTNGMKSNGLALTGANSSGVSLGGLTNTTLASSQFATWFNASPAYANMVMTYVVRCAVPAGQTRTYSSGSTTWTWQGLLGIAPLWSAGMAINSIEQQVVSACLGAHANRFGVHVPFSILGFKGDYTALPLDPGEAAAYPNPEGAFFGNLFNGGTVYSCSSSLTDSSGISGPRECAMGDMPSNVCAPLVDTGTPCSQICFTMPVLGNAYAACHGPDGQWYLALNTQIANSSIYWCGDGTCQFTESCYDSASNTGCLSDCGSCQ